MADTVERIVLQSNVQQVARQAETALDKVADALGHVREKSLDIDLASKAGRLAAAEKAVTAELRHQVDLEAKIATFDASRVRKVAELEHQYEKMNKAATKGVGPDLGGPGGLGEGVGGALAAAGIVAAGAAVLGGIAEKIASSALEVTVAASKLAIAASDFRTETSASFQHMYGSAAIADGLYEKVLALAIRTGQSKEHFAEEARKLAASGFHADEVPKILQSLADYEKVKGAGSGDKIEKLLEKVNAQDKFDAKSVNALAKQGIATADVYAVLEKKLGKTHDQVQALLKAGQIKGDTGIDAVLETLDKKFGGAAKIDTVGGGLLALKTKFESLFDKIDTSPIKDAMSNVLKILEGPAGGELKTELTNTIGALFHTLFDPFKGPGGAEKIERIVHTVSGALRNLRGTIEAAAPVVSWIFEKLASWGGSGGLDEGAGKVNMLASSVLLLLDAMTGFTGSNLVGLFSALEDLELPDLGSIGSDLIKGLEDGITSGAAGVVDALVGAVTSAKSAAERVLGIASPSKVFEKIGGFTTEGMAVGMRRGANDVGDAGGDVAKMAWNGAAYAPAAGGGAGGGGGGSSYSAGPSTYNIAVHMPEGATGGADAGKELYREFERQVRRYERDRYERVGRAA